VFSREEADDPRAAIDLAAERLEHQILKAKDRLIHRQQEGGIRALNGERNGANETSAADDADELESEE
jgi:ribosome-associated translation inhibitor RaiA